MPYEISIIVQLKEVAADGRAGRLAVGSAKISCAKLVPQKRWSEYFFQALRRAMDKRQRNLHEIHELARPPAPQTGVLFEEEKF